MPKNKKGKEAPIQNIIIKKSRSTEEAGHHGGTWKIAYADFMTAMMAFFLVMWLVSSSSKEKITQLANYFNPVKLSDKAPPARAVRDEEPGAAGNEKLAPTKAEKADKSEKSEKQLEAKPDKADKKAEKAEKKPEKSAKKSEGAQNPNQNEDEALFSNPFGVLTQLASEAEGQMAVVASQINSGSASSSGMSHDPFVTDLVVSQPPSRLSQVPGREVSQLNSAAAAAQRPAGKTDSPSDDKQAGGKTPSGQGEQRASRETEDAAAQLAKDVNKIIESLPRSFRPNITTKATPEGILVSLTDDLNFSMFKIASAEPSPQLVVVLEKIGNLINKQPGKLVVRGHTDGRQYTGDTHGNWRLSVNRANMAYYMLLRAKVEDTRFLAVEGYADRSLKNKGNPLAAENRRIDILIKGAEL